MAKLVYSCSFLDAFIQDEDNIDKKSTKKIFESLLNRLEMYKFLQHTEEIRGVSYE